MNLCQRLCTPEKDIWVMSAYKFVKYLAVLAEDAENQPEPDRPEPKKPGKLATVEELMKFQKTLR